MVDYNNNYIVDDTKQLYKTSLSVLVSNYPSAMTTNVCIIFGINRK